jgi:hypothetical protein
MKIIIKILLLLLVASQCSTLPSNKYVPVPSWVDPKMVSWIKSHSNSSTPGWRYIKWEKNLLAAINNNTSANTNTQSQQIVDELNQRFTKTSSNNTDNTMGDYADTGILIHGLDEFDGNGTLFDPLNEYTATSYIRADISKNVPYPLWNHSFHFFSLGEPGAGVIYSSIAKETNKIYRVNCSFDQDASSDARYRGCNTTSKDIKAGRPSFKDKVDEYWNNNQSMNLCQFDGITNLETYLKKQYRCAMSGSKDDFNIVLESYQHKYPLLRKKPGWNWNEIVIRIFNKPQYINGIQAIYYYQSYNNNYYASPQEDIKTYNIHLGFAQKQQRIAKQRGVFIPIVELNMDKVREGQQPFIYYPEDQVVDI